MKMRQWVLPKIWQLEILREEPDSPRECLGWSSVEESLVLWVDGSGSPRESHLPLTHQLIPGTREHLCGMDHPHLDRNWFLTIM